MKLAMLLIITAAAAPGATFEAASVRPTAMPGGNSSMRLSQGRVTMENVSLRKLILGAWGIPDDRTWAISGPAFLATESFDIQATFPEATPVPQVLAMLQGLLYDRFHLALHKEARQLPNYTLVAAKGGPRLRASNEGHGRTSAGPGTLEAAAITMQKLADLLSRQAGLPVTDGTGLTGTFSFILKWSPSDAITATGKSPEDIASDSGGPSIFTALREQLGLRLESGKRPVEVLVVDQIDRHPTAN